MLRSRTESRARRWLFLLEERERVRIVTFEGSEEYDRTEIDEALEQSGVELRLDTRIGPRVVRRTEGLLREMYAEKGYQFADVSHEITPVAGGPKIRAADVSHRSGTEGPGGRYLVRRK